MITLPEVYSSVNTENRIIFFCYFFIIYDILISEGGEKMTIGEKIKRIRKEKGLTQKKLGQLCGINEVQIRQYEIGKANPKIETVDKIATGLGIPIYDLLGESIESAMKNVTDNIKNENTFLNYLLSLGYEYIPTLDNDIIGDGSDRGIYIKDESITIPLTKEEFRNLENDIIRDVEIEIYKLRKQKNL